MNATEVLLDEYVDRASLARALHCSERTVARYENQPNGLPNLVLAGRKLYRLRSVREWLERRENKPNPSRNAARA
ncbi:MAG: hypothetical protein EOS58_06325 [Mesorhizobium sp.]|uniref:hypothetical protein n=1 Tax=Mesorhizobium sp. M4A.F.Ca.ET.022.05.2.1 TaxID=2496653 RepID=UPI000FC9C538|nr:hypothetical protein [Mesorhizobium sp. M4A.F.Ca.ET.022.05.2.1]RVC75829.1 hypothetical protein EN745_26445 [Mesorhizobium sp. M4A.F.Ca.ET.022.05.2.1]RWD06621.1 MAG: hypothetical protein EOS58_06325 [Mesorhizobium sp.]